MAVKSVEIVNWNKNHYGKENKDIAHLQMGQEKGR